MYELLCMYEWVPHLSKSKALRVFFSYACHTYRPGTKNRQTHVAQFQLMATRDETVHAKSCVIKNLQAASSVLIHFSLLDLV